MPTARANPFSDVPSTSWPYVAVEQLRKSGFLVGYPDGEFHDKRVTTRYQLAVTVQQISTALEEKLAAGAQVDTVDIAALRKLIDEFEPELVVVEKRIAALESKTSELSVASQKLSTQVAQDGDAIGALQKSANAMHVGMIMWSRPGTFSQSLSVKSGGIAKSTLTSVSGGTNDNGIGSQSLAVGSDGKVGRAVDYSGVRINFSGSIDPRISYGARIETYFRPDSPTNGLSTTTPGYCTSLTPPANNCGAQDYAGTTASFPIRLSYAWFGYYSPGGFFARIGRIVADEGRNNMAVGLGTSDEQGVQFGYHSSTLDGWVMPVTSGSSIYNGSLLAAAPASASACPPGNPAGPVCLKGNSTNGLISRLEYYASHLHSAVGATYDGFNDSLWTGWNPYAGLCVTPATAAAKTSTTAGAGSTTWNTVKNLCPASQVPLVYGAGNSQGIAGRPVTGAYQTLQTGIKAASVYYVGYFGPTSRPTSRITTELLWRLGNDPFSTANPNAPTQSAWKDNRAFGLEYAYASKGNLTGAGPLVSASGFRNSNVAQIQYYNQGLNGATPDSGTGGGLGYQGFYYGNFAGMQQGLLNVDHWFTDNFRLGLTYTIFSTRGALIPAGSTTCPGCNYSLTSHGIALDSFLSF